MFIGRVDFTNTAVMNFNPASFQNNPLDSFNKAMINATSDIKYSNNRLQPIKKQIYPKRKAPLVSAPNNIYESSKNSNFQTSFILLF